jgi:hypothetical protein
MRRNNKEHRCNHGVINFNSVEFMINDSRIELRCRKCNNMVGWWHIFAEKIKPIKRAWSEEECLAMK